MVGILVEEEGRWPISAIPRPCGERAKLAALELVGAEERECRGQIQQRIEQRKDAIVYVASPGGRPPTDFPLVDLGKDFVLFANPEHDFPKEIRYELTQDGLHARVSGDADGKEQAEEWTWKRVQQ